MALAPLIIGVYGLLSLIGGIIGCVKAKSTASLIAGSVSGIILIACAIGVQHGHRASAVLSGLVAISLGGRFFTVWRHKRRVMPDLIMMVGAVIALIAASSSLLAR